MTSEGRTAREALQAYRGSLNRLLSHTITRMPIIATFNQRSGQATISFRQSGTITETTLPSRYGPIELRVLQTLDVVEGRDERFRLRVIDYQYTITPLGADDPLFRWEFVRFPSSGSFWCQNHLQGPIDVGIGGWTVNLNAWHLPTGPVPIEEIIRFCIVELGVLSLDTGVDANGNPGWHVRLTDKSAVKQA